jgi:hypothetical protein
VGTWPAPAPAAAGRASPRSASGAARAFGPHRCRGSRRSRAVTLRWPSPANGESVIAVRMRSSSSSSPSAVRGPRLPPGAVAPPARHRSWTAAHVASSHTVASATPVSALTSAASCAGSGAPFFAPPPARPRAPSSTCRSCARPPGACDRRDRPGVPSAPLVRRR